MSWHPFWRGNFDPFRCKTFAYLLYRIYKGHSFSCFCPGESTQDILKRKPPKRSSCNDFDWLKVIKIQLSVYPHFFGFVHMRGRIFVVWNRSQIDMSALWFDEMFRKVEWYSALQGFTQMKTVNRNACTLVGADSDIWMRILILLGYGLVLAY